MRFTRTFRWNDGESTEDYAGVEVDDHGVAWFRWSHRFGAGRIEEGRQTFAALLEEGPRGTPPAHVAEELRRIARERSA